MDNSSLSKLASFLLGREVVSVARLQSKVISVGMNSDGDLSVVVNRGFVVPRGDDFAPCKDAIRAFLEEERKSSIPISEPPRTEENSKSAEAALFEFAQSFASEGIPSEEETVKMIEDTTARIKNMVEAVNSAIHRLEMAGRAYHTDMLTAVFVDRNPNTGAQGGVKILSCKNGHPVLIWRQVWEPGASQAWYDSRLEHGANRLRAYLEKLSK